MAKNNIRSIRFSDELAELIDRQIGDTFTQKFESLIYRAFWELPEKENELKKINKQIEKQLQRLTTLQKAEQEINTLENDLKSIKHNFMRIKEKAATIAWEVEEAKT